MCKFIKYEEPCDKQVIYLNVRNISEVRHNTKDGSIELVITDPAGECETKYLEGKEAKEAVAIIASCVKP